MVRCESRTEAKDAYRASVSLASVVVASIWLDGEESLRQARRDFLRWLNQRVIKGRFTADVDLARAVLERLKEFITQYLGTVDKMGEASRIVMRRFWSDLPDYLRKLMEPDQEFLRTLGISKKPIIEIRPLRIESQAFWGGLSRVAKDRTPREIETLEGHAGRVELASDSPIFFSVHCDALQFDGHIGGHEFVFLSDSFAEREAGAVRLERWFDLPKSQRDELVARVVGGHDPATRVDLAREARRTSGAELYQDVYESIREGESFRPTDTMPLHISVLVRTCLKIETGAELIYSYCDGEVDRRAMGTDSGALS